MLVVFTYHYEGKPETSINNNETLSLVIKITLKNSWIKEEIKLKDKLLRNGQKNDTWYKKINGTVIKAVFKRKHVALLIKKISKVNMQVNGIEKNSKK